MKKRGFTLIELLAVIVVLAIIAVIATPLVLNTIEEARQGAAKASALTYVSEVEKYMVSSQLDGSKVKLETGKTYSVNNADGNGIGLNDIIDIKGDKPTSGTITIGEDNTVEKASLTINNYGLECASKTCEVIGIVEEAKEVKITSSQNTIKIGETLTLNYEVLPATTTNKTITWESSNPNVASVDNGIVTGISNGTVTITATTANGVIGEISLDIYKNYEISNLIINSGFEDNTETGLAEWNIQSNSGGITDEVVKDGNYSLKFVSTVETSGNGVYQLQALQKDHVYYAMEFMYAESTVQNGGEFDLYRKGGTITGYPEYGNKALTNLEASKWTNLNFQFTYTPEDYDYWFRAAYTVKEDVILYIDSALLVDLTETFGAGNEPSLEWCNQYISWFDGSSTIYYK